MDTREIIDLLDRIAIVRRSEVRSEGAKHGLPAVQLDALRYLAACNRFSDTPASVAEFLDSTRGTISQTLIALERKRLIRKYTDPTDGRVVHCVPTHKGREILKGSEQSDVLVAAVESMPSPEQDRLGTALAQLVSITQDRRGRREFGRCLECSHYTRNDKGTSCALLDEVLHDGEEQQICRYFGAESSESLD